MFKVDGNFGVSRIEFFIFSGTGKVKHQWMAPTLMRNCYRDLLKIDQKDNNPSAPDLLSLGRSDIHKLICVPKV